MLKTGHIDSHLNIILFWGFFCEFFLKKFKFYFITNNSNIIVLEMKKDSLKGPELFVLILVWCIG